MNRRGFFATLAAVAMAPFVKREQTTFRRVPIRWVPRLDADDFDPPKYGLAYWVVPYPKPLPEDRIIREEFKIHGASQEAIDELGKAFEAKP